MKSKNIMESNRIRTGDTFTLNDIFTKDNRVVIPDLQRDYCWGKTSDGTELVSDFINNIIRNGYDKYEPLNLGLIYGYETPIGHIQLCDGQQRVTTLFLLLGLLNKKSENRFRDRLISDFEYNYDDREPYLQYSIRESSLYFLSDLVCHFFMDNRLEHVADIKSKPARWYFRDYDFDPSIVSMLEALAIMENLITDVDAQKLGDYICNQITFMYYDMEGRSNGEETFVVINTTGEPLSPTESLKPCFVAKQENLEKASEKWEEWETWFWEHRNGAGNRKNDTADNGFQEFFRWITLLTTTNEIVIDEIKETGQFSFDVDRISETIVSQYFNIVQFLFGESGLFTAHLDWLAPNKQGNDQIVWFRLLPVIEYIRIHGCDNRRNIIRVKIFFEHLALIGNVQKAVGDLFPQAIRMIRQLPSEDIAQGIYNAPTAISSLIMSDEQRMKFELYLTTRELRIEMEDRFWKAENHKVWRGEIMPLLQWSANASGFDFKKFKEFDDLFNSLFHGEMDYPELDITRRALLTIGLTEYPKVFRGYTNRSFCWEFSDWHELINENVEKIGRMFTSLLGQKEPYAFMESEMIAPFPHDKYWAEFVHIPKLLAFCHEKNIQWDGEETGWILLEKSRRTGPYANLKSYRLFLELKATPVWNENTWKLSFYKREGTCAYLDYEQHNIAIDIFHSAKDLYTLQLFSRKGESIDDRKHRLSLCAHSFSLEWNGERFEKSAMTKEQVVDLLKKLCDTIS